jgi:tRNA pseudouridine38-40 synthase
MKRVMLEVAYDGTRYCGWQVQQNGVTVAGVITEELKRLLNEDIQLIGASRTDAGVHAMGNVCVFDTESRIPAEKFCYALNHSLPEDIVIQRSKEVPLSFHPRKVKCRKTYEYRIWNADFIQPFNRKYTYFVYKNLDVEKMKEAAAQFIGTHDFTAFCSIHTVVPDHVRTIYEAEVTKDDNLITFRITGNGFLYNMVRIIAGTLVQVGLGEREPESIREILESGDRGNAGPTAPAQGLTLMRIDYADEEKTKN